jgi:hypothetical protein
LINFLWISNNYLANLIFKIHYLILKIVFYFYQNKIVNFERYSQTSRTSESISKHFGTKRDY